MIWPNPCLRLPGSSILCCWSWIIGTRCFRKSELISQQLEKVMAIVGEIRGMVLEATSHERNALEPPQAFQPVPAQAKRPVAQIGLFYISKIIFMSGKS